MNATHTYFFAGGGTGGHLYPAIAIAEQVLKRDPGAYVHFVGTTKGIESRVIPEKGYPLHFIAVRGMARRLTLSNLLVPFRLLWSLVQCFVLLLKYRPKIVVGTGGYVSGPVLFCAACLRIPTLIQEQNSYPGVTTRLLAKIVTRVHISFKESAKFFKNKKKLKLTGNPVRDLKSEQTREYLLGEFNLNPERTCMLVFGGSQGAKAINAAVLSILPDLIHLGLDVIWSTGKYDFDEISKAVEPFRQHVWCAEYISDMPKAYAVGDIAIARAGAISLAELMVCGIPSVLIPYPFAAANHQEENAKSLVNQGAADMILQSELTPELLLEKVAALVNDSEKRQKMAAEAQASAFPQATDELLDSIFQLIGDDDE